MIITINMADVKRQERAIWQGLVLDLIRFVPLLVVAIFSGSLLLLSDGVNYLRNFAARGTSLHVLRRIRKGQTLNYDFGAGKMECFGSLIGAGIFILVLLWLATMSLLRLRTGLQLHLGFTFVGLLLQGVDVLVDGTLWFRDKRIARDTHAPLIDMQWRHNRTDALSSASKCIALTLILLLNHKSWAMYIDPMCALVTIIFSIGLYLPVVRNNLSDLLDRTLEEDLQIKIMRRLAEHFDQYEAFHGVRSRRSGSRIFIDIILGFHPERKVGETASTIKALRSDLEADIPRSAVNIIMEPM